jgi:uncharacterized protein (UPF0264 family)
MKLLISAVNEEEAVEAVKGGADIIDVKNPIEGSLGASFPWVIKRIKDATPHPLEVSCALGDLPNLPGSVSLAALGAATTGVDYIKAGLYGVKNESDAIYLMQNIVRASRSYDPSVKVVATGYADAERVGALNPLFVPEIVRKAEADVAMIDTAMKDGESLFSFLSAGQLKEFVREAHDNGSIVGLAGSLKKEDLSKLYSVGVDIVGLRGAVCPLGDRVKGRIEKQKVVELVEIKKRLEAQL